jgi:hypothetical protein
MKDYRGKKEQIKNMDNWRRGETDEAQAITKKYFVQRKNQHK